MDFHFPPRKSSTHYHRPKLLKSWNQIYLTTNQIFSESWTAERHKNNRRSCEAKRSEMWKIFCLKVEASCWLFLPSLNMLKISSLYIAQIIIIIKIIKITAIHNNFLSQLKIILPSFLLISWHFIWTSPLSTNKKWEREILFARHGHKIIDWCLSTVFNLRWGNAKIKRAKRASARHKKSHFSGSPK